VLTLNAVSADMEWIKTMSIDFPDEITLNSSTDLVGPSGSLIFENISGPGISAIWTSSGTWGEIHEGESATCTINITFSDAYIGAESELDYTIFGDGYGSDPHQVNNVVEIANENSFWLSVSPDEGQITYNSDTEVSLNYNTEGMEEGVYNADIIISDGTSDVTIPVELTVDWTIDIDDIIFSSNLDIYPNPFISELNISLNSDYNQIGDIYMYDIAGKLVDVISTRSNFNAGQNTLSFDVDKSIQRGMYIIKVSTANEDIYGKVVKK